MNLRPIRNNIIFQFEESSTVIGGRRVFQENHGRIIFNRVDDSLNYSRWVRVTHVGPDVGDGIKVGSRVCVHHGKWTYGFKIDESGETYWKTDSDQVVLVDDRVTT